MSEWRTTTIGDCLATSFAGEWGVEPNPANAVVYRATDIDDEGRIVGSGAGRRLPIGKLASKMLQDGDILLEGSGGGPDKPVGRVAYFDGMAHSGLAACSNFFKTLRPDRQRVDPRFFLRKLTWFYKQPPILALQQQTTGIINLKFEEYLASSIEVPQTIPEQCKIAQILDTLDADIQETEAIIAKLKAVKQGLLHDLLTRGIDANGELRPPQSEAPHLYKDSPLGWIPKEWDCRKAEELLENIIDYRGKTPSKSVAGIPLITAKNVRQGFVDPEPREYLAETTYRSWMTRGVPRKGDVLFTTEAPLGNVAEIETDEAVAFAQRIIILRPIDQVPSQYLKYRLMALQFQSQLLRHATGTTALGIKQSTFRTLPIPAPTDPSEMSETARRLSSIDARIESERAGCEKLRMEKMGLMDDLLTGRIRVTPLLKPASI